MKMILSIHYLFNITFYRNIHRIILLYCGNLYGISLRTICPFYGNIFENNSVYKLSFLGKSSLHFYENNLSKYRQYVHMNMSISIWIILFTDYLSNFHENNSAYSLFSLKIFMWMSMDRIMSIWPFFENSILYTLCPHEYSVLNLYTRCKHECSVFSTCIRGIQSVHMNILWFQFALRGFNSNDDRQ